MLDFSELHLALRESIPTASPPVYTSGTRVYVAATALQTMIEESESDLSLEVAGQILGTFGCDEHGLWAQVEIVIPATGARQGAASVHVTSDALTHIATIRESRYRHLSVLGWYHSHPGFGAFLSRTDVETFWRVFPLSYQVAAVIDPKRGELNFFRKAGHRDVERIAAVFHYDF